MYNIVVIVGSLRKESFNKKLMRAIDKLNHPLLKFTLLDLKDIPLYNQDDEMDMPSAAKHLKKTVENADGILFVTPEYNRSIPGVLKDSIDWGTRPYGKNPGRINDGSDRNSPAHGDCGAHPITWDLVGLMPIFGHRECTCL